MIVKRIGAELDALARLGVVVPAYRPAYADRALAELLGRGGRAQAFELAQAVGATLAELAPTLAWLAGHGLANVEGAAWQLPNLARESRKCLATLTSAGRRHSEKPNRSKRIGVAQKRARAGET